MCVINVKEEAFFVKEVKFEHVIGVWTVTCSY